MKKLLLYIIIFISFSLKGQVRNISGFINTDLVFYSDTTYIFNFNCRIASLASLTINPGVKVKFSSGVSVIVDGDIYLNGTKELPINISSDDLKYQGIGFVISGNKGKELIVTYSIFNNLLIPLTFKDNWFRERVFINHNIFKETNTGQPAIYIGVFSQLSSIDEATFDFSYNSFIENNATIYFSDIEDDILELTFQNNLITSNIIFSNEDSNPLDAPFSFSYDQRNRKYLFDFNNNVIINNKIISFSIINDSRLLSIGVNGSAESIELSNNFLGNKDQDNTLTHFYQNNSLPLILLTDNQEKPSDKISVHLYKVMIYKEGEWRNWNITDNIYYDELKLKLSFNKEIVLHNQKLDLFKLSKDSITKDSVNFTLNESDNFSIILTLQDINLKDDVLKLLSVNDNEGNISPKYFIGNINKFYLLRAGRYKEFKKEEWVDNNKIVKEKVELLSDTINKVRYKLSTSSIFPFMKNADNTKSNLGYSISAGLSLNNEFFTNIEFSSFSISETDYNTDILTLSSNIKIKLENLQSLHTSFHFRAGGGVLLKNKKKKLDGYFSTSEKNKYIFVPVEFGIETQLSANFSIGGGLEYSKVMNDIDIDFFIFKLGIIKNIR